VIDGPTRGRGLVSHRSAGRASRPRAQGGRQASVRAAPAAPCARGRVVARGDPAAADPAPARPLTPVDDRHLPGGHQQRGDHLHPLRKTGADDPRQRRPRPVEALAGAHPALPRPRSQAKQQPPLTDPASPKQSPADHAATSHSGIPPTNQSSRSGRHRAEPSCPCDRREHRESDPLDRNRRLRAPAVRVSGAQHSGELWQREAILCV
jgi:hypothetical protein